jgi:DNA-binding CsgD family transcriptional regulator
MGVLGPRFRRVELGPLDRQAGIQLARELRPGLAPERAASLWRRAQGSPFWIEALARDEAEDPGRIMFARLGGVTTDGASLCALLAVAGRPLAAGDAASIMGWPEGREHAAGAELVNAGLAVPSREGMRLAHDLLGEAARRDLPGDQRRKLHTAIASWLETEAREDDHLLLEALQHRRAGGLPTLPLALRIAESPGRRLLGASGLQELAGIADEAEPPNGQALQREVASLAAELGEHELALERWSLLAERTPAADERARCWLEASKAAFELHRTAEASSFLERCRSLLGSDGPLAIEADAHESKLLRWLEHRMAEAKSAAARATAAARRMAESAGDPRSLDRPSRAAYLAAMRAGYDTALVSEELAEMLRIAEEMAAVADTPEERLRADLEIAFSLRLMGRLGEAERRLRRTWGEIRRWVLPVLEVEAGFWLANTLYPLGRLEEARALAEENLDLWGRLGDHPSRQAASRTRCLLHEIQVSQVDWRSGTEALADVAAAEEDPHHRLQLRQSRALWLSRFGGEELAEPVAAAVEEGFADVEAAGCDRCRSEFTLRGAESWARSGWLEEAHKALSGWDGGHSAPDGVYRFWRQAAKAAIVAHEDAGAGADRLRALEETALDMGLRLEALWARLDLGRTLATLERDEGIRVLQEAAGIAQELGAASEAGFAERALRELGVRTWRRGPARPGSELVAVLTGREFQIGRLVAAGASNPEIAEKLFLSRKTIERHVSNILAKLALRNRAELAARMAAGTGLDEGVPAEGEGAPR